MANQTGTDQSKGSSSPQTAKKTAGGSAKSAGPTSESEILAALKPLAMPLLRLALLLRFYSQERTMDQIATECAAAAKYVTEGVIPPQESPELPAE
jgi:type VI protein secretion system component VasF